MAKWSSKRKQVDQDAIDDAAGLDENDHSATAELLREAAADAQETRDSERWRTRGQN